MSGIAIVTGGARGIGAATSLQLAEAGYDICVNFNQDHEAANRLCDTVIALGRRSIAVQADVASEQGVEALFETCLNTLGTPDVLVNNAGVVGDKNRVDEISLSRFERMFAVNVTGTFLCCRAAVRIMSTAHGGKGGNIINISSVASRLGAPGEYVDYAASKGAVDTFTIGLAREVATEGIRVNAIRPGIIDTEIHASGGQPDRVDRLKHLIPMQRGGLAEEVAGLAIWLASPAASYTTGSLIDVSGGR